MNQLEIRTKRKIMLDTNFLLTLVRNKIHGLEELKEDKPTEFFTLGRVLFEIEVLGKREKKIAREASIVQQILKANNVKVLDSTLEDVDAEMVEKSKEGYIIATNDKFLRQRIRKEGGKTAYIRSMTFVEVDE